MPEAEGITGARVAAWETKARQAWIAEDFTHARQLFEKVLDIRRSLDSIEDLIFALIHVTQAMRFEQNYDPPAAQPLLDEAFTLAEQLGTGDCVFAVQGLRIHAAPRRRIILLERAGTRTTPAGKDMEFDGGPLLERWGKISRIYVVAARLFLRS